MVSTSGPRLRYSTFGLCILAVQLSRRIENLDLGPRSSPPGGFQAELANLLDENRRGRMNQSSEQNTMSRDSLPADESDGIFGEVPLFDSVLQGMLYDEKLISSSGAVTASIVPPLCTGYPGLHPNYVVLTGPEPFTFEDFWEIVLESKSSIIVTLNQTCEETFETPLCFRYWPDRNDAIRINKYMVQNIGSIANQKFATRTFIVSSLDAESQTEQSHVRIVTQYQFMNWQYGSVPACEADILSLLQTVNKAYFKNPGTPIILHEGKNMNRVTTYLAVDSLTRRILEDYTLDEPPRRNGTLSASQAEDESTPVPSPNTEHVEVCHCHSVRLDECPMMLNDEDNLLTPGAVPETVRELNRIDPNLTVTVEQYRYIYNNLMHSVYCLLRHELG